MDGILNVIIEYISSVDNNSLYFLLFISAVVENLFPPAPGDTVTAFGAFLVGIGRLDYLLVYFFTTAGSSVGFMCLYSLGRVIDNNFFHKRKVSFFSSKAIDNALSGFNRYGYAIVLVNRFLPGIRSVISISAGIVKLRAHFVFLFSIISAMLWNLIWIQTGYMLGGNWSEVKESISEIIGNYNKLALLVIFFLVAGFFLKKILVSKSKD